MAIITLTSDFGLRDHFVAALKATLFQKAPDVSVFDITHEVRPFDVAEAAFHVSQACQYFPKGTVHLIAVDTEPIVNFGQHEGSFPSVLEWRDQYFVANDNGFFGALNRNEEEHRFFRLDDVLSNPKGFKFPSRNMLLPIAIRIAQGEKVESVASPHKAYKKAFSQLPVLGTNLIKGHIIHFDSFGNAVTNIDIETFERIGNGAPFMIRFRQEDAYRINEISATYNEVPGGERVALFGETGLLEIAINRGANAGAGGAERLFGMRKGDIVRVEFQPRGSVDSLESLF